MLYRNVYYQSQSPDRGSVYQVGWQKEAHQAHQAHKADSSREQLEAVFRFSSARARGFGMCCDPSNSVRYPRQERGGGGWPMIGSVSNIAGICLTRKANLSRHSFALFS